jgi:hypothetical protein
MTLRLRRSGGPLTTAHELRHPRPLALPEGLPALQFGVGDRAQYPALPVCIGCSSDGRQRPSLPHQRPGLRFLLPVRTPPVTYIQEH